MNDDTSGLVGGPIKRNGAKGKVAPYLVPHFAPARVYAEAFFGAGSVFYRLAPDVYERIAVNDLDRSIVTFFRVLRDRTDDLVRACEFTPYARDEFIAALERSDDDLEEARRGAVEHGAKVAVSGYPSALYDELFAGWRRIEVDVPLYGTAATKGQRRTECLWMSYPESESFAGIEAAKRNARQPSLGGIL